MVNGYSFKISMCYTYILENPYINIQPHLKKIKQKFVFKYKRKHNIVYSNIFIVE